MLVVISLLLMTADHRYHHLDTIRMGLNVLFTPLQYLVDLPVEAGEWASGSLTTQRRLEEENRALRARQLEIQAKLLRYEALEAENDRLRGLQEAAANFGERKLIAELLAVDMDPVKRQAIINKGSRDGVFVGQPVLDAHGVIGQVTQVTPFNSTVILITDPSHGIPVQVLRTGMRAIALGNGSLTELDIPHLPYNVDLQQGDLLITSGLGGRFPPGYPVARIKRIRREAREAYAEVVAEPTGGLERSREVLLVWYDNPLNAAATTQTPAAPATQPTGQETHN